MKIRIPFFSKKQGLICSTKQVYDEESKESLDKKITEISNKVSNTNSTYASDLFLKDGSLATTFSGPTYIIDGLEIYNNQNIQNTPALEKARNHNKEVQKKIVDTLGNSGFAQLDLIVLAGGTIDAETGDRKQGEDTMFVRPTYCAYAFYDDGFIYIFFVLPHLQDDPIVNDTDTGILYATYKGYSLSKDGSIVVGDAFDIPSNFTLVK